MENLSYGDHRVYILLQISQNIVAVNITFRCLWADVSALFKNGILGSIQCPKRGHIWEQMVLVFDPLWRLLQIVGRNLEKCVSIIGYGFKMFLGCYYKTIVFWGFLGA